MDLKYIVTSHWTVIDIAVLQLFRFSCGCSWRIHSAGTCCCIM